MSITRKNTKVIIKDDGSGLTTWNTGLSVYIQTEEGVLVCNAVEVSPGAYTATWTATPIPTYGYWYVNGAKRDDWGLIYLGAVVGDKNIDGGFTIDYPLVVNSSVVATSFSGGGSGITGVISSSYALSSSFATSASYAVSSSHALYADNNISASYAATASSVNPLHQTLQLTGSFLELGNATINGTITSTNTGSFTGGLVIGGTNKIDFNLGGTGAISTKLDLYGGVYKIGIESYTMAFDADSTAQYLFRINNDKKFSIGANITASVDMNVQNVGVVGNIQVPNFSPTDPITGWQITNAGVGSFNTLFATSMHVKAFIADIEQALAGSWAVAKSVAKLSADVSIPSSPGNANIVVDSFEGYASMNVFVVNDIVRFRQMSRTSSSLEITDTWGVVQSFGGFNGDGTQQTWNIHIQTGPNFSAKKGQLVLDYGVPGNGVYEVSAVGAAVGGAKSPFAQITTWNTAPYTDPKIVLRQGDLTGITSGLFGALSGIGFWASGSAYLEGSINAGAGKIGGWTIDATKLYNGTNIVLDANNQAVSVANGAVKMYYTNGGNWGISGSGFTLGSTNQIANWNFTTSRLYTGLTTGGTGGHRISINTQSVAGGADWYTDDSYLEGFDFQWWSAWNAGHLILGQLASNATTGVKTGYYGLQMMDFAGREYFALAANTTESFLSDTGPHIYNRIAGWSFDNASIWGNGQGRIATSGIGTTRVELNGASGSLMFVSASAGSDNRFTQITPYTLASPFAGYTMFISSSVSTPVSLVVASDPAFNSGDILSSFGQLYIENAFNASSVISRARITTDPLSRQKPMVYLSYGTSADAIWTMCVEQTGELGIYQGDPAAGSTSYRRRVHINSGSNAWTAN